MSFHCSPKFQEVCQAVTETVSDRLSVSVDKKLSKKNYEIIHLQSNFTALMYRSHDSDNGGDIIIGIIMPL